VTELRFDAASHSIDAIQRAAYKFTDVFSIDVAPQGNAIRVVLHAVGSPAVDDDVVNAFRTEVLDAVLRERIRTETEQVRNLILSVAFSQRIFSPCHSVSIAGRMGVSC
jgi:His-Xaa-Ser system protein HxsD